MYTTSLITTIVTILLLPPTELTDGFSIFASRESRGFSERNKSAQIFARPKRSVEAPPLITSSLQIPTSKITERLLQLTSNPNIAILIDAENIRGKTNFELSHSDLLDRLMVWALLRNHALGRTVVVIDHGSKPTAHLLSQIYQDKRNAANALCVTFAGPILKADDIIARDTQWLLQQDNVDQVIVITNDRELSYRCRHANPAAGSSKEKRKLKKKTRKARKLDVKKFNEQSASCEVGNTTDTTNHNVNTTMRVNVISSKIFLEDMEYAMQQWLSELPGERMTYEPLDSQDPIDAHDVVAPNEAPTDSKWHKLSELRTKILHMESCLRKKCTVRKRQQLTQEMRRCKEQWEAELSSISDNDSASDGTLASLMKISLSNSLTLNMPQADPVDKIDAETQKQMLLRWGYRRGSPKREATEDRVILAEMVRSQLDVALVKESVGDASLVEEYAKYINNRNKPEV